MLQQLRVLAKGYLPNTLITPVKLKEILKEARNTLRTTNPDYDLVIDRLHLYYDMQLVTINTNFAKYLEMFPNLIECLQPLLIKNRTMYKQILPVNLSISGFDKALFMCLLI